jgi:hypothetical protein
MRVCEWPCPSVRVQTFTDFVASENPLGFARRHFLPQPTNGAGSNLFGQQPNTTPGQVDVHAF